MRAWRDAKVRDVCYLVIEEIIIDAVMIGLGIVFFYLAFRN